jgi:hypothetical protein
MNINVEFIGRKIQEFGSFLFDKQFWFKFALPVAFALGVFPYLNENDAVQLSEQAVAWAKLIVPLIASLLLGFSTSTSAKKAENILEELIKAAKK